MFFFSFPLLPLFAVKALHSSTLLSLFSGATRFLALSFALVQISAQHGLDGTHARENAEPDAGALPVQSAPLVQTPGLVAQVRADADDGGEIRNGQRAGAPVRQAGELADEPVIRAAGLFRGRGRGGPGTLSGALGLLFRRRRLGLALYPLGLRLRLHVLLEEVGRHGAHAGHVDIDERRRGRGLAGDDFDGLRSSGLQGLPQKSSIMRQLSIAPPRERRKKWAQ